MKSAPEGRFGVLALRRVAGVAFALAAVSALAACSTTPAQTFDLSAPTTGFVHRVPHGLLVIAEPAAAAPADADRIVVRTGAESVAYLKGAQWADRLPRLVQTRLVQAFDNAHLMRSVARPEDALQADFRLISNIRRFEIDAATNEAVVSMSVKLVSERTGRIVAGKIFTATEPGSAADGKVASAALDAALADELRQIVAWSAARM